jgi:putative CocE/NonD family hydrolase
MPAFITEFRYHDEALPYDPEFTPSAFSPCHYAHQIPSDVAVLSVSGWMDGAGYQNGAIARFLTLPNRNKHLLLGPWDHGARINVSPWRRAETPEFSLDGELLRFFDTYLMGLETGLSREAPVHYFTMHEEAWREAVQWPPAQKTLRLSLSEAGTLSVSSDCVHWTTSEIWAAGNDATAKWLGEAVRERGDQPLQKTKARTKTEADHSIQRAAAE